MTTHAKGLEMLVYVESILNAEEVKCSLLFSLVCLKIGKVVLMCHAIFITKIQSN